MNTIELGRPVELDEETSALLESIIEGEGDSLDPELLRAAIPDRRQFIEFLQRRNLMGTPAAKSILMQLRIAEPKSAVPVMVAKVAAKAKRPRRLIEVLAKRRSGKWGKFAARKKMRKAKRRKFAKTKRK